MRAASCCIMGRSVKVGEEATGTGQSWQFRRVVVQARGVSAFGPAASVRTGDPNSTPTAVWCFLINFACFAGKCDTKLESCGAPTRAKFMKVSLN